MYIFHFNRHKSSYVNKNNLQVSTCHLETVRQMASLRWTEQFDICNIVIGFHVDLPQTLFKKKKRNNNTIV